MGEVTYREATSADCDGIVGFMHEIQAETEAQKQTTFSKVFWQWQYATWERGSCIPLACDDGKIIGYNHCSLFDVRYKGRRVIGALFDQGATEVRAELDTRNVASIALLERLGLKRGAFKKNADHFKGSESDEWTYSLPRPEHCEEERGNL